MASKCCRIRKNEIPELVGQIIDVFEDYLDAKDGSDEIHIQGEDFNSIYGSVYATLSRWGLVEFVLE